MAKIRVLCNPKTQAQPMPPVSGDRGAVIQPRQRQARPVLKRRVLGKELRPRFEEHPPRGQRRRSGVPKNADFEVFPRNRCLCQSSSLLRPIRHLPPLQKQLQPGARQVPISVGAEGDELMASEQNPPRKAVPPAAAVKGALALALPILRKRFRL